MENYFGSWLSRLDELSDTFCKASPFEHVIIPGFFQEDIASSIIAEFPDPVESDYDWKHYDNPIEQKYTLNDLSKLPKTSKIFNIFQSRAFVDALRSITNISELESDPYLHGAGLHAYPSNGKLDVHLDYSIHPIIKKERRVNLIVYLNKDWKSEYGGDLQLWDAQVKNCTELVMPSWNTAVLFRTSDISYHGIPKPMTCPEGKYRKSMAIYYVSEPRENCSKRFKAEFVPLPNQPVSEELQRLYNIRKDRIITEDDLQSWPTWRVDGNGHW